MPEIVVVAKGRESSRSLYTARHLRCIAWAAVRVSRHLRSRHGRLASSLPSADLRPADAARLADRVGEAFARADGLPPGGREIVSLDVDDLALVDRVCTVASILHAAGLIREEDGGSVGSDDAPEGRIAAVEDSAGIARSEVAAMPDGGPSPSGSIPTPLGGAEWDADDAGRFPLLAADAEAVAEAAVLVRLHLRRRRDGGRKSELEASCVDAGIRYATALRVAEANVGRPLHDLDYFEILALRGVCRFATILADRLEDADRLCWASAACRANFYDRVSRMARVGEDLLDLAPHVLYEEVEQDRLLIAFESGEI